MRRGTGKYRDIHIVKSEKKERGNNGRGSKRRKGNERKKRRDEVIEGTIERSNKVWEKKLRWQSESSK